MKSGIIVLMIVSLLVLSGAAGCQNTTTAADTTIGLEMAFSANAPPVSSIVDKEFPIYIEVINKGGEYINKDGAKFYLEGIGKNLDNVKASLSNDKTLSKESVFPDKLVFSEKAKFTFPLQNMFVLPLVLTSCYTYSTRAQGTICIAGSNESKVCSLKDAKTVSNTAGPVQISDISEEIVGNKIILSFDILNKGKGQIYLANTNCDKLMAQDLAESMKQGKINIKISTSDGITCKLQSDAGQILALEGMVPVGKVTCEKAISDNEYSSVLTVELRYKYKDLISQSINILPA